VILCSNSLTVMPIIIAMSTELYSKTVTGLAPVFRPQTAVLGRKTDLVGIETRHCQKRRTQAMTAE